MVIFRIQGYFGHFLCFEGILVIFRFWGVFWSFFGFRGYFCHFVGFGVILVIFKFWGYFGHFSGLGVFWSFYFLFWGGILVIFRF